MFGSKPKINQRYIKKADDTQWWVHEIDTLTEVVDLRTSKGASSVVSYAQLKEFFKKG